MSKDPFGGEPSPPPEEIVPPLSPEERAFDSSMIALRDALANCVDPDRIRDGLADRDPKVLLDIAIGHAENTITLMSKLPKSRAVSGILDVEGMNIAEIVAKSSDVFPDTLVEKLRKIV